MSQIRSDAAGFGVEVVQVFGSQMTMIVHDYTSNAGSRHHGTEIETLRP